MGEELVDPLAACGQVRDGDGGVTEVGDRGQGDLLDTLVEGAGGELGGGGVEGEGVGEEAGSEDAGGAEGGGVGGLW